MTEPALFVDARVNICRGLQWLELRRARPPLQERKFLGGSSQISEFMAKELDERVKLRSPVHRIDQSGDVVAVETLDKQTYTVRPAFCFAVLPGTVRSVLPSAG